MRILTPNEMATAEQSSQNSGVPLSQLMENAGEKLAECVNVVAIQLMKKNVLILCGNGNNGGDGLVCANRLVESGLKVNVQFCCGEPKTELAKEAFSKLSGKVIIRHENTFAAYDIIVDCVFGTGYHGSLPEEVKQIFDKINILDNYIIACDIPSGVNSLTGEADSHSLKCNETIAFHAVKVGAMLSPANEFCGTINNCDIGIPDEIDYHQGIQLVTEALVRNSLPRRERNSHKGTFGRLMCICGSKKFSGAAALSAVAAARCGVGLVNICTPASVVASLSTTIFETTFTALNEDENGGMSVLGLPKITAELKRASAVLIGCGIGKTTSTIRIVGDIIKNATCPIIIDADGINCLCENINVLNDTQASIILTPHQMELARLFGQSTPATDNRLELAKTLSDRYGVTVIAKGCESFITTPYETYLVTSGNTALSKGGSGDMLAGMTASFAAQGMPASKACVCASYILGAAAEKLCETKSPRGILARDILNILPEVLFNLE